MRACARGRGGLPHLLVLPVSIVVKELQTKRPRQVRPVSDSMELFGVPRDEVLVASGVGHGVESVYFCLSHRQFFLPLKPLHAAS